MKPEPVFLGEVTGLPSKVFILLGLRYCVYLGWWERNVRLPTHWNGEVTTEAVICSCAGPTLVFSYRDSHRLEISISSNVQSKEEKTPIAFNCLVYEQHRNLRMHSYYNSHNNKASHVWVLYCGWRIQKPYFPLWNGYWWGSIIR